MGGIVSETDDIFRVYAPEECGSDGYPRVWHDLGLGTPLIWSADLLHVESWWDDTKERFGVKDLVRAMAGQRCLRCGHPYWNGTHGNGEWSLCDERCTHLGPYRAQPIDQAGIGDECGWNMHSADEMATPSVYDLSHFRVEAQWRILTVHHLLLGNDAKRDLRWWNLVALCQRCHLTIQRKVLMEQVYVGEHTPWFRPYAAGWYAWSYLGENLTREQTLARLDELLALERVG